MVFSSIRLVGASTLLGSRLELRILDTATVGTDTATVGSLILGTSGRDTIRATPPAPDLPDPEHTRTTFVVLASLASAKAGV